MKNRAYIGKYVYTFENRCKEVQDCSLEDGATKIFLNTKGENADEVSEELIEFLNYVERSTDRMARESKSERVRRIHDRVCKVKLNEKIGVKYMQAWEEKYYEREEGRQEGIEEGRLRTLVNQVCKKLRKGFDAVDIAEMLEEEEELIQKICKESDRHAPDCDIEVIVKELM